MPVPSCEYRYKWSLQTLPAHGRISHNVSASTLITSAVDQTGLPMVSTGAPMLLQCLHAHPQDTQLPIFELLGDHARCHKEQKPGVCCRCCCWLQSTVGCSAYLSMSEAASVASSNFAPYDQYEVSIPLEVAGDCLHMVSALTVSSSTHHPDVAWAVKCHATVFVAPCMLLNTRHQYACL